MKVTFRYKGKVYNLNFKFISNIKDYVRKLKLVWYKKRKVNESKTEHARLYHMKFRINLSDEYNSQVSDHIYEMVVPAKAAFFSKILLERSIRQKVSVEVVGLDEISDEEYDVFIESKQEYINNISLEQSKIAD